jgi:hypothetical protein
VPPPFEQFASQFRSLPPDERAAFVAEVLRSREWDTDRDGRLIVATRGQETKRIHVGQTPPVAGDVDEIVVVPSRFESLAALLPRQSRPAVDDLDCGSGVSVLDPGALYQQLLYAVEREDAKRLYRDYFGAEFDTDHDDSSATRLPGRAAVLAGFLIAIAVASAVLAGVVPGVLIWGESTPGGVSVLSGEQPDSAVTDDQVDGETLATPTPTGTAGVSPEVIRDPDRLARAHTDALQAHPVAMEATFTGPRFLTGFDTRRSGFDANDTVTIRAHVESDSRYYVVRETKFTGTSLTSTTGRIERFADGSGVYLRIERGNTTTFQRRGLRPLRNGSMVIDSWTRFVVLRYLNTTETDVEQHTIGGGTRYRLVATGDPLTLDHETQAYRAVAVVEPDGWIRGIRVTYRHPNTGSRVVVTVRYDRSPGTVDAPGWYEK